MLSAFASCTFYCTNLTRTATGVPADLRDAIADSSLEALKGEARTNVSEINIPEPNPGSAAAWKTEGRSDVNSLLHGYFKDSEKNTIGSDLDFVFAIKSAACSPLHSEVFGGCDGAAYRDFIKKRIRHIRVSMTLSDSDYALTVPAPYEYYHDTIVLRKKFFRSFRL